MAFSDPEENIKQFHLEEGMIVADLGAGSGAYTRAAAKVVGESGIVYAVEVQKEFLETVAKSAVTERLENIEVIWGDIETIGGTKIDDNKIDAVILSNVLFQVPNKHGLIAETKRILKPKGKILVVDWLDSFGGLGPQPSEVVSPEQAKQLFDEPCFAMGEDIDAGSNHYGFIVLYIG